ncbi:dipeptide/oligopeptide/nickel ABC transporter ATP-binding protein [Pullulanibacillus camelliae]|uniref:Dipeptide/oligopeptide/nickel ABC transporter ATP-binding protein n=1 Tax=Pullulanibacillus camelliae TaxID=1707096 RepID=A0A8J2VKK5_9BACL|nr:ABC transporter ATP-binding protein [Pullulanibacillus camelliae]GGE26990.1 dipeptide/oligopeptide/nickel ABC transporter ATP-binding protein [Pullulanibacillus camelliae]
MSLESTMQPINKDDDVVLAVKDLFLEFDNFDSHVTALHGLNFTIRRGEILGLVGESGCGKSLTSLSSIKLLPKNAKITGGEIQLAGTSITHLPEKAMKRLRGNTISMIFQEPMTALNPLIPVGKQIEESLILHKKISRAKRRQRVIELLQSVGIPEPEARYHQFPYELSGGMRQRIMIAMALACDPKLIIADEPTTALDVTIQSQILDLIKDIRERYQTSILIITHDLGVVADVADKVAVMYAGHIVEIATVHELYDHPSHPYTKGLLNSIPDLTTDYEGELDSIKGSVPDLSALPAGCPFQDRCKNVSEKCRVQNPQLAPTGHADHFVACWHPIGDETIGK